MKTITKYMNYTKQELIQEIKRLPSYVQPKWSLNKATRDELEGYMIAFEQQIDFLEDEEARKWK